MKPTPSEQQKDPANDIHSTKGIEEDEYPFQHIENIIDGSEFLDDAIRMKDQPLEQILSKIITEESFNIKNLPL